MAAELHKYFPGKPGNSRERIQDLLREKNMSQAELAEKIGLSESALSRYLSGQTDKLSADNIVSIARVFDVTTDFLLCLTDIPFTTNFDIEKLGLTVDAAKNLLERKVNPNVISTLLEMQEFILLTQKLDQIRKGTMAAGIASMRAVFKQAQDLLLEATQDSREERLAIREAITDIKSLQPVSVYEADTSEAEAIFRKIMQDFRAGSKEYVEKSGQLTSAVMKEIVSYLRKRINHPEKLRGITSEMMVDSILNTLEPLQLTDEQKEALRTAMLPLVKSAEVS